jgi:intein/homing endonuclease
MNDVNEEYWYKMWHTDFELHEKLGIKNIKKIEKDISGNDVSIYADTDSVEANTKIITNNGVITIDNWYNQNIKNGSGGETLKGHESVITNDKVLNWNNEFYMAPVKRIIRHKVTKPKWKLKTKSGKEVIVTNDHSMIVFRNGLKLEVKPSEILKTDKILTING